MQINLICTLRRPATDRVLGAPNGGYLRAQLLFQLDPSRLPDRAGVILSGVPDAAAGFSSSAALPIVHEACKRAGIHSGSVELLCLGENAIYRLDSAPGVVRIARSEDRLPRVKRELCVARWLAGAEVPAARVYEEVQQPLVVDGHPVTFWRAVTGGDPAPTHLDLARLLAEFHALADCPCALARFDPLATPFSRLAKAKDVAREDRDFLHERCVDLNDQLLHMEFALKPGPIHGDAHTRNLLTDRGPWC